MADTRLTIRQMCDMFDVTPRTLRFYAAKELLFPDRVGQKRLFTTKDQARMKLILRGKRFGFSLEVIRQLLDLYYIGDGQILQITKTIEIANERLVEMESRRTELDLAIDDLKMQIAEGVDHLNKIKTNSAAE